MNLDFSALDNIGSDRGKEPAAASSSIGTQDQSSGTGSLQRRADLTQRTLDQARQAWSTYQDNVKKSEVLKTDIIKGVQRGEDLESLFLKAVEVIGLLTDDTVMLDQVKRDLKRGKVS